MKNLLRYLTLVGLSFGGAGLANADAIVGWEITGVDVNDGIGASSSAPYTFSATTVLNANVSGELTLGAGVNPTTTATQYGFKISSANAQTTLAGAISNNHYLQFSVTVASGFLLNLSSIDLVGDASSTGSDNVAFFTSIDGFTAGDEIASAASVAGITGGLDSDGSGFGALDLSAGAYQGLSGTVDFRIYGYNSSTSSGAGTTKIRNLSNDDLVVNGTLVAVPEPSSAVLAL